MYMRLHTKLYVASENFIYLFEVDSRQFLSGCYHFLEFILLSSTVIGENIIFIYHLYSHRGKYHIYISSLHSSGKISYLYIISTFIGENILFIYPLYIHRGKYPLYISSLHSSGKISSLYARCRSLASRNE